MPTAWLCAARACLVKRVLPSPTARRSLVVHPPLHATHILVRCLTFGRGSPCYPWPAGSSVSAPPKKDHDMRSVAVGETLRRVATKSLFQEHRPLRCGLPVSLQSSWLFFAGFAVSDLAWLHGVIATGQIQITVIVAPVVWRFRVPSREGAVYGCRPPNTNCTCGDASILLGLWWLHRDLMMVDGPLRTLARRRKRWAIRCRGFPWYRGALRSLLLLAGG